MQRQEEVGEREEEAAREKLGEKEGEGEILGREVEGKEGDLSL